MYFLIFTPRIPNLIDLTDFQCISTETKLNAYTGNMETTTHSLYIYDTNVVMVCPEMRKNNCTRLSLHSATSQVANDINDVLILIFLHKEYKLTKR
mgnify:CR=1 FL=1